MEVFPTLSVVASAKYNDEIIKPIVRVEFEGNYNQTRPKYGRSAENFNLTFRPITETDKTTLKTFFDANSGNSFTWINPSSDTEYTVRFVQDRLKFTYLSAEQYEIIIPLEEV